MKMSNQKVAGIDPTRKRLCICNNLSIGATICIRAQLQAVAISKQFNDSANTDVASTTMKPIKETSGDERYVTQRVAIEKFECIFEAIIPGERNLTELSFLRSNGLVPFTRDFDVRR